MEQNIDINFNSKALDNAIKKANRLVELLREAQQIIDSLSREDIKYVRELAAKKCESAFQSVVSLESSNNEGIDNSELINEIKEAMERLGYRDGTRVEIKSAGFDRYELYVDGKTFGIWDSQKKTFVD